MRQDVQESGTVMRHAGIRDVMRRCDAGLDGLEQKTEYRLVQQDEKIEAIGIEMRAARCTCARD